MQINRNDIEGLGRVKRLKLINALSGIKPANLIGTISEHGNTNLAIFSSVVHIGSNPPLLGLFMRPTGDVPRHSFDNIKATGVYTINHVNKQIIEQAHYTSAKFERQVSEFDECRLTEEYIDNFKAPFVGECHIKIGMILREIIPIKLNNTILMIGEVAHVICPDDYFSEDFHLDLSKAEGVGISGLNTYFGLNRLDTFPYARLNELPNFDE